MRLDDENRMIAGGEGSTDQGTERGRWRELRFGFLLAALLLLLLFYPFHDGTPIANLLFAALNLVILAAGVFAANRSRKTLLVAVILGLPTLALQWIHLLTRDPLAGNFMYVAIVLFYIFTIWQVLAEVLRPGMVTQDNICGAIAAYILTAVAWAALYGLVDNLVPGSFVIYGQSDTVNPMTMQDFLFFSFTTLTSTGYGDILPVSRHAQSLAMLEQMAGVFYVAILIARLAGLYQPRAARRHERRPDDLEH